MKGYVDKEEKVNNSRLVFGDKEKENGLQKYLISDFSRRQVEVSPTLTPTPNTVGKSLWVEKHFL